MWNFSNSFGLSGACKSPQVGVVTKITIECCPAAHASPVDRSGPAARVAAHKSVAVRHERSSLLGSGSWLSPQSRRLPLSPPKAEGPIEAIFIGEIVVLMLVGRMLGEAMVRLRQPAVMGR